MDDTIVCPVCGETNPADMALCLNCQWPLRSLAGTKATEDVVSPSNDTTGMDGAAAQEVPDWLRDLGAAPQNGSRGESGGLEDWQKPAVASPGGREIGEVPDWVARIAGTSAVGPKVGTDVTPPAEGTAPTQWPTLTGETPNTEGVISLSGDRTPKGVSAGNENGIHDWLRRLDASGPAGEADAAGSLIPIGNGPARAANAPARPDQSAAAGSPRPQDAIPDWLEEKPAGSGEVGPTTVDEGPSPSQGPEPAPPELTAERTARVEAGGQDDKEPNSPESSAGGPHRTSAPFGSIDVDAVVTSMQTPDWLSDVRPRAAVSDEQIAPAAQEEEPIAPAELPSWVEALRPVESIMQSLPEETPEEPLEERGPLLGLQGVLTAIPGAGKPSSRPRVRAMRLEVNEQQRSRAALLEDILVAETKPIPLKAAWLPGSQRSLRWAISAILVVVVGGTLGAHSRAFPLPMGVPNETLSAIRSVENIPTDSRVLVVFDYEPATVGEMEASAASLIDHMLLLRHPILAVLSTSPTGSVLAERFMSSTVAARAYQPAVGYVNLGYLPGGLAGVRAFAEDPLATVPLDAKSDPAWETPALQGVTRLSDFAAILVLTDGLESGRVWIEQTAYKRGQAPMIIVSSAQAGPMLLPYAASGQVGGLVMGLNGAAGAEMANGGQPGFVRRYWDAYSLGMYVAAFLIVVAGAWYLWAGLRARRMRVGT